MFQSHTMIKMKIIHTHCMFRHVCTIFMSWTAQECSCIGFIDEGWISLDQYVFVSSW